jgi:hypothetical protein
MKNAPIIVIGMHRSGTTLLTQIMQSLGIFMGEKMFNNREAVFFQDLNKWLLYQSATTWDQPNGFSFVNPEFIDSAAKVLDWRLQSFHRHEYLGKLKSLKYRSVKDLDGLWGWKDPVNSITLEVWMKVFPQARILNIIRNPIDVAASLQAREEKRILKYSNQQHLTPREKSLEHKPAYGQSYRVLQIEEGINLATEYMRINKQHCKKYENQSLTLRYEDLMVNPSAELRKVLKFINLEVENQTLENAIRLIDTSGGYKFIEDKQLMDVFNEIGLASFFTEFGFDQP